MNLRADKCSYKTVGRIFLAEGKITATQNIVTMFLLGCMLIPCCMQDLILITATLRMMTKAALETLVKTKL